jgi:hypothetical protein
MGALDALKKAALKKAEEPKKKGSAPILDIPVTEENKTHLKTIIEERQKEKNAENTRKKSEAIVRPLCEKLRDDKSRDDNEFHSSVKVQCGDIGPVTFVTIEKYSAIGVDKEDELRGIYGDEYDKCYGTNTSIALTELGMKNIEILLPLLQEAAAKVVGVADDWTKIFNVSQGIKPTNYLHQQRVLNPKIAAATKKAIDSKILKPQTPHFVA